MRGCYKNTVNIQDMAQNPVNVFYQRFVDEGKMCDYMARRGQCQLQVIVGWTTTGPKSFQAGRKTKFTNNESQINSGTVKGIELFNTAQLTINPTQPPTDTPDAQLDEGWLVLVDNCNADIVKLPLSQLCKETNGGKLTFFDIPNLEWGNCYVVFPRAGGISQANSLVFRIYLDK